MNQHEQTPLTEEEALYLIAKTFFVEHDLFFGEQFLRTAKLKKDEISYEEAVTSYYNAIDELKNDGISR